MAVLEGFNFDINVDDVLTFIGYDEDRPAPKKLREKAQAMREKCLELVKPRVVSSFLCKFHIFHFLKEREVLTHFSYRVCSPM